MKNMARQMLEKRIEMIKDMMQMMINALMPKRTRLAGIGQARLDIRPVADGQLPSGVTP